MISPTEVEIIITEEECEVPQDYIETVAREVPAIVQTNYTYKQPTIVKRTVFKSFPRLVNGTEDYDVPVITYTPT